jgi:hypothetical protein
MRDEIQQTRGLAVARPGRTNTEKARLADRILIFGRRKRFNASKTLPTFVGSLS